MTPETPLSCSSPFGEWLASQSHRRDAIGDLARRFPSSMADDVAAAMLDVGVADVPPVLPACYHGGRAGIPVGTQLLPAGRLWATDPRRAVAMELRDQLDPQHRQFVYGTSSLVMAVRYAVRAQSNPALFPTTHAAGLGIYRIELSGAVEVDRWRPDIDEAKERGLLAEQIGVPLRARSATVVEVL